MLVVEGHSGGALQSLAAASGRAAEANVTVVQDGAEALAFLHRRGPYRTAPRPAIILLDLDLPESGARVLADIKSDPDLKRIPVVVFAASRRLEDVQTAYGLQANCYVPKPADASQLAEVLRSIEEFWLTKVRLPGG